MSYNEELLAKHILEKELVMDGFKARLEGGMTPEETLSVSAMAKEILDSLDASIESYRKAIENDAAKAN